MEVPHIAPLMQVNDDDGWEPLAVLAFEVYDEFLRTGSKDDIDRAVLLARASILKATDAHQWPIWKLCDLKRRFTSRYVQLCEMADLDAAIAIARREVDAMPANHRNYPEQIDRLRYLGVLLMTRYEKANNKADLDEAIIVERQAVDSTPADHPDHPHRIIPDLDEVIAMIRQAVYSAPADHPDHLGDSEQAKGLILLEIMLVRRHDRIGKMADLDEAIMVSRQSLRSKLVDHPDKVALLINLGVALHIRYDRAGKMTDLEEAIDMTRQGIDSIPGDHPDQLDNSDRPRGLNSLGNMLVGRYKRLGKMADIEEAVMVFKQAVKSSSADHHAWVFHLTNLGGVLLTLYERTGKMTDLEDGIAILRHAVKSIPTNRHTSHWVALWNNLGTALMTRYGRTGKITDLEEAIAINRQAVDSTPAGRFELAVTLHNLGNLVFGRYMRTGESADLEEAIALTRQAVDSTPADHPDLVGWADGLANKLLSRYKRTRKIADLEESMAATWQAFHSTPVDHPAHARLLSSLGIALLSGYDRLGDIIYLEQALNIARQAVTSIPVDHHHRIGFLFNVGFILAARYERLGKMTDLEEGIIIFKQALNYRPTNHSDLMSLLLTSGILLTIRAMQTGKIPDMEESLSYFQTAWSHQNAPPLDRIHAGSLGLIVLIKMSQIQRAIELGQDILDLLPIVNPQFLSRNDQQFVIASFGGVAVNVCACFIAQGQPVKALESLERGRAVIIGQLVDGRNDVSSLRLRHYDIACRYEQLLHDINGPLDYVRQGTGRTQAENRRSEAMSELDRCVREIRDLAGHERFLLGQTESEMRECAKDGTIVVVNLNTPRSDAILVSKTAVRVLNLPRVTGGDALAWSLKRWTGHDVPKIELRSKNKEYAEYLVWLWDVCVRPILDAICLSKDTSNNLPRVWWIGSGLGSSMPFHAAGVHSLGSTENTYSRVISSYTPSIKTLGYSQRRAMTTQSTQGSLLVVTMPTTPAKTADSEAHKVPKLRGVLREKEIITATASGHVLVESLDLPSASQVVDKLQDCSIAHFACHGSTDPLDPSKSGLILQKQDDGGGLQQDRLTVQRVSEQNLGGAHIAYLSACSTAENKAKKLADEVIHVVSGFQVAGFPHVVGSLWPTSDSVCVEVAETFYRSLFQQGQLGTEWDGRAVAQALQEAVLAVREEARKMPLLWAQFVHFGA